MATVGSSEMWTVESKREVVYAAGRSSETLILVFQDRGRVGTSEWTVASD